MRRIWAGLAAAALATGLAASACAQPEAKAADLVLRGGRIVDVETATVSAPVDVLVREGRIAAIRPAGKQALRGARIVDASGRFLAPGYVEMHAHILTHPWLPSGEIARQYDREASLQILRSLLAHGITTVRDPGSPTEAAIVFRRLAAEHVIVSPEIVTAGRIINASDFDPEPFMPVKTAEDVRREVAWQADRGVDFIKVYYSMPPELIGVAVEAAHARGLKVVGHLQLTDWGTAAALGLDGVAHAADWSEDQLPEAQRAAYRGDIKARIDWINAVEPDSPAYQAMARAMAAHGMFVDPTLMAIHTKFFGDDPVYRNPKGRRFVPDVFWTGWEKGSFTSGWTAADYARAHAAYPRLPRLIRALHDAGVLITVGTDTPTPWTIPGVSFHQELALLKETGVSNAEVLKWATLNGAKALGRDDRVGRLEAGYEADIVVLRGNPLDDLAKAGDIALVVSDGRIFEPDQLAGPQPRSGEQQ